MADVKISGLPASTTPLAGTEVLPIVQSGATKQVSVANLTAGRSVAALSVITPTIQAEAGSAGGTIKNGSGVAQMQWGSGGGSNLSLEVATNINPANAVVNISPTGTGTVAISPAGALTINPTAASTINNTSIGVTTAAAGRFSSITNTALTAGRVSFAGTAGLLTDSANFTYAVNRLTATNSIFQNGGLTLGRDYSSGGVYNTLDFVEGVTTAGYLRNYGSISGGGLDSSILLWNTQNSFISFGTNNVGRMRIHASGGVSIGNTTDPGATNLSATGTIRTGGYTVATLPAAGVAGRRAYVTDATLPTYLGALVGGGAVVCPVFDNGTAWVSA